MKILHFADAHIDMANYGKHDPESGLPFRVLDFLKSLDAIVDAAISEKVDMVIFAGDAYKDRSPAPTFQREWGRRIMRLSQAKIPTLLLIGNHDVSPSIGRAHALQEFDTLQVPYVRVLSKIQLLKPNDLWGIPIQVIALPWISRSAFMTGDDFSSDKLDKLFNEMEDSITDRIQELINETDKSLPLILTAHLSVLGAKYGGERMVMLGSDMVVTGSLVRNTNFDYVALGHIHKAQNLNEGFQPPVIYPGSIERVDFGEEKDDKFFVIAEIEKGNTNIAWRKLENIRPFITKYITLESSENITQRLISSLPSPKKIKNSIVRLIIKYPREFDTHIDDNALFQHTKEAFEFHLVKHPQTDNKVRIPGEQVVSSLSPLDLLDQYWKIIHAENRNIDVDALQKLAQEIISDENVDK